MGRLNVQLCLYSVPEAGQRRHQADTICDPATCHVKREGGHQRQQLGDVVHATRTLAAARTHNHQLQLGGPLLVRRASHRRKAQSSHRIFGTGASREQKPSQGMEAPVQPTTRDKQIARHMDGYLGSRALSSSRCLTPTSPSSSCNSCRSGWR